MFPKILPGLIGKIEFLSGETEKISGGADFLEAVKDETEGGHLKGRCNRQRRPRACPQLTHTHTYARPARGNAHTWDTFPAFPLPQPTATVGEQGAAPPHHRLSRLVLRGRAAAQPPRRAPPSRGARGAGVGQLWPLRLSHWEALPPTALNSGLREE